jgi:hypothetical protein
VYPHVADFVLVFFLGRIRYSPFVGNITVCTDLPTCDGSDRVRLICMGKGYLMPDTRTLEDCQIPVFKTHPTPVNVSVLPVDNAVEEAHGKKDTRKKKESTHTGGHARHARTNAARSPTNDGAATAAVNQGCACILL